MVSKDSDLSRDPIIEGIGEGKNWKLAITVWRLPKAPAQPAPADLIDLEAEGETPAQPAGWFDAVWR